MDRMESILFPALNIAIATAAIASGGLLWRWGGRGGTVQVRLDRGLRGYISTIQR